MTLPLFAKQNFFMKKGASSAALVVTLLSVQSQSAFAWGFRLLAGGGYENFQIEDTDTDGNGTKEKPKAATGANIGLVGQAELIDIVPTVKIVGGLGLKKSFLSSTTSIGSLDITTKLSPQTVGPEAGLQIGLIPLITVQAVAGYDFGLGGTIQTTLKSTGSAATLETTPSKGTFDSHGQFHLTGRALLTVFPLVSAGLEAGWQSGKFKYKDKDDSVLSKETKYSGYKINAVVSLSL